VTCWAAATGYLIGWHTNVWIFPDPAEPDQTVKHYLRSGDGTCDPLAPQ